MANSNLRLRSLPDQAWLLERYSYSSDSGALIRKSDGKPITYENNGYIVVNFNDSSYRVHRIIWKMMTGEDPDGVIDHINQVKNDNSWSNLRVVSNTENHQNRKLHANNSSGCQGVVWIKKDKAWSSRITVNGKRISLGYFKDFNLAVKIRKEAEIYYGFSPNHGRKTG